MEEEKVESEVSASEPVIETGEVTASEEVSEVIADPETVSSTADEVVE